MKNIFIAIAGNTPQIITESLYYYTQVENIAIHEIHIITTLQGEASIEKQLFDNGRGFFYRFCDDYQLNCSRMGLQPVKILCDEKGYCLEDIRTVSQNIAAANQICNFIREKTEEKDTRLLCSLAGGRKTMSSYMAFAMQFFARPQDRLSHVLIQPSELENSDQFYYPAPNNDPVHIINQNGNEIIIPKKDIRIDLAEIHFIRLRDKLNQIFRNENLTYQEMVYLSQGDIDKLVQPPFLTFYVIDRTINIKDKETVYTVRLQNKMAVIYHYLLINDQKSRLIDATDQLKENYITYYKKGMDVSDLYEGFLDQKDISQLVSKINKKILDQVNNSAISYFCEISRYKTRGKTHHKIQLMDYPDHVEIKE